MAIDLCIESAGWVAQFVEANAGHSIPPLRRSLRSRSLTTETTASITSPAAFDEGPSTEALIRTTAAELPIDQARAIWLIDMCGCSYDEAAATMGVTRDELATEVTSARQAIRSGLAPAIQ